jgi:hypothetical protein
MDNINVFFILTENYADSAQASEIMIQAFEVIWFVKFLG